MTDKEHPRENRPPAVSGISETLKQAQEAIAKDAVQEFLELSRALDDGKNRFPEFLHAAVRAQAGKIIRLLLLQPEEQKDAAANTQAIKAALKISIAENNKEAFGILAAVPRGRFLEQSLWSEAAAAGKTDFLEICQRLANNQTSGSIVETGFIAACSAGQEKTALWFLEKCPQLGITGFGTGARAALERGYENLFLSLLPQIAKRHSPARQKVFDTLFDAASGMKEKRALLALMPYMAESDPDVTLRHAVLSGHAEVVRAATKLFGVAGKTTEQHIERAFIVACANGLQEVSEVFLDMGVDITIYDNGPSRWAVNLLPQKGFQPIAKLLEHGADPEILLQMLRDIHPAENRHIATLSFHAAETRKTAFETLRKVAGENFDSRVLRTHQQKFGMTGLHFAATRRVLLKVLEKTGLAAFSAEDFIAKDRQGRSVLDIMAARGDLPALFTPQFMAGQQKKATTLYAALPKKSRAGIDLPKLLHQLNMQNLAMQNGGGFVLRRGKSGQAPGLKK